MNTEEACSTREQNIAYICIFNLVNILRCIKLQSLVCALKHNLVLLFIIVSGFALLFKNMLFKHLNSRVVKYIAVGYRQVFGKRTHCNL